MYKYLTIVIEFRLKTATNFCFNPHRNSLRYTVYAKNLLKIRDNHLFIMYENV